MRVVRLRAAGGPEQLALEEAHRPRPGPAEALVRVQAAAITRGELEWSVDRLPAITCYELSGVVEQVGRGVAGAAEGGGRLLSVAAEPPEAGVYFIVEPNRDQLDSLTRLVDGGDLRPQPVEVFRRGRVVLAVAA
jgi:NADPH:quinone reductase-like Zn-dependent oxidoreductase